MTFNNRIKELNNYRKNLHDYTLNELKDKVQERTSQSVNSILKRCLIHTLVTFKSVELKKEKHYD